MFCYHRVLVILPGLAFLVSCGPAHYISNEEIPNAQTLRPIMWSQARLADPAFKKITVPVYLDADWAAFTALGQRLQISSVKLKQDFSEGDDWNKLTDALHRNAGELIEAAKTKDHQAAATTLAAPRANCRACHKEFR